MQSTTEGTQESTVKKNRKPKSFRSRENFSWAKMSVFILVFGVIGGYILYHSFAASSFTVVTDNRATPVGTSNNALQITASGDSTGNITASAPFSYINIRAKGVTCSDATAPAMQLKLDDTVIYTANVTTAYWGDYLYSYTTGQTGSTGAHTVAIALTNPATVSGCTRTLSVDSIKFYAADLFDPLPIPDYADNKNNTFNDQFAQCDIGSTVSVNSTTYSAQNHYVSFAANGGTYGATNGAPNPTGPAFGASGSPCYSVIKGTGPNHVPGHQALFPNHASGSSSDTVGEFNTDNSSENALATALSQGWDVIIPAPGQITARSGGAIGYSVGATNQITVAYYKAIMSDIKKTTANGGQDVGAGKMYFSGFSAASEIPIMAACYLGSDVSAVVTMAGQMHGPAADSVSGGFTPCQKPSNMASIMFVLATNASFTNSWEGQLKGPGIGNNTTPYTYSLHITPGHTSLTQSDIDEITTAASNISWYNALQTGEGWAVWEGCGNNLASLTPTNNTSAGSATNLSPGGQPAAVNGSAATFWNWTGCTQTASGQSGEIQLYVISGAHGLETGVIADGKAWSFLSSH